MKLDRISRRREREEKGKEEAVELDEEREGEDFT